jgi:hypothetical protein
MGWDTVRTDGRNGTGDWNGFDIPLERIYAAADKWRVAVGSEKKLWLCWNISHNWSLLQQRMVAAVGWTPVVGFDPNCQPRSLDVISEAIFLDFNADLGLKVMWPHFPLEFAFLWADRLAFWHADLVMSMPQLIDIAHQFAELPDGGIAAVYSTGGLRNVFRIKQHRYWELLGCTTAGASRHQFEHGCGWWRNFESHPKTPLAERAERATYYYDSGVGVRYWEKRYQKKILRLEEKKYLSGHCSEIGYPGYYKKSNHKGEELDLNFDLEQVAERFQLTPLLHSS